MLSELFKPAASPVVRAWLNAQPADSLFTTAITEAEILYGIEFMPVGRILAFDSAAAREYPPLADRMRSRRGPGCDFDVQAAAIARSRKAIVATRSTCDFDHLGLRVVDPWRVS